MQKPPPDQETVIADLWSVFKKHFHGYGHSRAPETRAICNAVDALNKPKTEQELVNALQNQSHAIDAAGWSGAAVLMRDAARRISWHLQHGVDMPGATIPLPKDQLVKELVRFSESEKFDVPNYTKSVLLQAAQIIKDILDKPGDDIDRHEFDRLDFHEILAGVKDCVENFENNRHTKELSQRTLQYASALIKRIENCESLDV